MLVMVFNCYLTLFVLPEQERDGCGGFEDFFFLHGMSLKYVGLCLTNGVCGVLQTPCVFKLWKFISVYMANLLE